MTSVRNSYHMDTIATMASSFIDKAFGILVYHLDPQTCLAIVSSKTHIEHAFGIRVSTFNVYGNISAKLNS